MAAFVERTEVPAEGASSLNSELDDFVRDDFEATPLDEVSTAGVSRQEGELDRLMQRVSQLGFGVEV